MIEREVTAMSNKERAIELLDKVPDYKMGYVLAYIQGITADEEADELEAIAEAKVDKSPTIPHDAIDWD